MRVLLALTVVTMAALGAGAAGAGPPPERDDGLTSGYFFARPDTQAMQADDFANPGLLWVERGADLWNTVEGEAGKSCASCHGAPEASMRGQGASYPKIDRATGGLINLGQRINLCRARHMGAKPFEPESDALLELETLVMHQSQGLPMVVAVDGAAAPWFERGRALYHQRVGQMNLACFMCHDQRVGHFLRAERISQGHVNGFPAYLLRWDRVASVHRRFQFCNEQARAEPLAIDSDDYNALQLYVAWRGMGLAIETPAVRR
jgi:sulfur-oxidizing protein SoxA